MSSGAPWPSLHTVNLSHNHIDKLDDSLESMSSGAPWPSLHTVNLSRNHIDKLNDSLVSNIK